MPLRRVGHESHGGRVMRVTEGGSWESRREGHESHAVLLQSGFSVSTSKHTQMCTAMTVLGCATGWWLMASACNWTCCVCLSVYGRYLRPTADTQQQPACGDSPPDPNTTSSGDECSNSAATSGEEVWGTPTSGGELDEELVFPSTVSVRLWQLTGITVGRYVDDVLVSTQCVMLIFSTPFGNLSLLLLSSSLLLLLFCWCCCCCCFCTIDQAT